MALTAKEMNAKYKETSEGGLAVSAGALLDDWVRHGSRWQRRRRQSSRG